MLEKADSGKDVLVMLKVGIRHYSWLLDVLKIIRLFQLHSEDLRLVPSEICLAAEREDM